MRIEKALEHEGKLSIVELFERDVSRSLLTSISCPEDGATTTCPGKDEGGGGRRRMRDGFCQSWFGHLAGGCSVETS